VQTLPFESLWSPSVLFVVVALLLHSHGRKFATASKERESSSSLQGFSKKEGEEIPDKTVWKWWFSLVVFVITAWILCGWIRSRTTSSSRNTSWGKSKREQQAPVELVQCRVLSLQCLNPREVCVLDFLKMWTIAAIEKTAKMMLFLTKHCKQGGTLIVFESGMCLSYNIRFTF